MLSWCRANKVDYLLGVAPTSMLRRHVESLEASTTARFAASDGSGKLRRFTEFYDSVASWAEPVKVPLASRVEYRRRAVSSASSPASRPGMAGRTRASSSTACPAAQPAPSTSGGIARVARRKTT